MEEKNVSLLEAVRQAKELSKKEDSEDLLPSDMKETEKSVPIKEISSKYKKIQKDLLSVVKGQDYAIEKICRTLFNKELLFDNKSDNRSTYANFFLFGPPGTGKTYTVETLAKLLNYPYLKIDMSNYAAEGEQIQLIGSDRQWRNASSGELTNFIGKNENEPHIVLFDEIEKAHKSTLDIFLSMLGVGELKDPYRKFTYNLKNSIFFFTSNSGKNLYKDNKDNSNISITQLLQALEEDVDINGKRRLSPEFCSRIVSGTPIIFNNLKLKDLIEIINNVEKNYKDELDEKRKIKLICDKKLPLTFLYMSNSKDARIISNRYDTFLKEKLFDIPFDKNEFNKIDFEIDYKTMPNEINELFIKNGKYNIIYIGNNENTIKALGKNICKLNIVTNSEELKSALRNEIDLVLVDPLFGGIKDKLISVTDYNSKGINLFYELTDIDNTLPIYILTSDKSMINEKDKQSLINDGARELICIDEPNKFSKKINDICEEIYIENNIGKLSNKGWILDFKNKLVIDKTNKKASIVLNKFRKYMDYDSDACKLMVKEDEKPNIKFNDIIGAKNAKEELKYFLDYLKDPLSDKNKKLKVPKGILLYGPPGTGKTMLAKAMACEADINYISLNGSDLLGRSTIEGVEKIKNVFESAKKYAPTIIFIDEIDTIAKKRIGLSDEAILNTLLTQMDGFKTNARKPVFILAATNFPITSENNFMSIDPAILRRFDSRIYVDLPDKKERIQFVEIYLKKKGITINKDTIKSFSECTTGSSLAEIENIIELAIRNSIKNNIKINDNLLLETIDEFFGGEVRELKQKEMYATAIHEAGHAIIANLNGNLPAYITIEPRAYYGGYVRFEDDKKSYLTKQDLIGNIQMSLAGRASEEVFFKQSGINSGASSDLKAATNAARKIVADFSMNGKLAVYGDDLTDTQKNEIEKILQEEYQNTLALVKKYKAKIKLVADELLKKNHLTSQEFKDIIK